MSVTVKFDPNVTQQQAAVIPDATPFSDGVMTKAQAAKLAGLAGGAQNFERTIAAGDGSDFFVTLPVPRTNANYTVMVNQTKGAFSFLPDCPNAVPTDRTTLHFRVVCASAPSVGDKLEFDVADKT